VDLHLIEPYIGSIFMTKIGILTNVKRDLVSGKLKTLALAFLIGRKKATTNAPSGTKSSIRILDDKFCIYHGTTLMNDPASIYIWIWQLGFLLYFLAS